MQDEIKLIMEKVDKRKEAIEGQLILSLNLKSNMHQHLVEKNSVMIKDGSSDYLAQSLESRGSCNMAEQIRISNIMFGLQAKVLATPSPLLTSVGRSSPSAVHL